ncbi:heparin lyase I family protein [Streptomyces sp. NPDC088812]|uniref:heparin lyase I family protein n=1 Tax=Streptomyces sp. NPDC088812 TaxID=3365905 RepID=UPI00380DA2A5
MAPTRRRTPRARRSAPVVVAVALAWSAALAPSAHAATVWDGDAAQGTGVFGSVECAEPGSLVTAANPDGHGTIFRYTKPSGLIRCESRGLSVDGARYTFAADSTYWLGWESQLSTVSGDFVVWQWKSYPNADQNYPLIMTVKDGAVRLFHVGTDAAWNLIWSAPVAAGAWHRFALGVHTSASASSGWVELYFDGTAQTFTDGGTRFTGRTWDSANEPKWGAYDRDTPESDVVHRVDGLRMGTTHADVADD